MCHGHTQAGKMSWAHYHNSKYPGRCCQPTCITKHPYKSSVMLGKSIRCLCLSGVSQRWHRLLNPHLLQMQGGSDQTALGNSHGCQTCNSSQGGTIKIKASIEHLCAVLRLNNRPLMDQGRPCSMAYVCVKPRVPNSVNAPNNWIHSSTLRGKPSRSVLTRTASNAIGGSADVLDSRAIAVGIIISWPTSNSPHKGGSPPRSQNIDSANFAQYFVSRLGQFQLTSEVVKNTVHLQSSIQEDLKTIFGREEMALALYAVVKTDQMVHFEAEFKALSNGESINPKSSIAPLYPFMDNGIIRVGGRLAHGYSMTDDQWFPLLVSHRRKLATLAKTMPTNEPFMVVPQQQWQKWDVQSGSLRIRRKRQLASRSVLRASDSLRSNAGWLAFESHWGSQTCFLLCGPRLRRTFNILKRNWMCQGLRSCVYMFCFKGSSSRGSIIIDVRCDGGSPKTIHCKTRHPQSNCVRQRNQLRGCKAWPQRIGKSGSVRGTNIQQHWMALHSSSLTQLRRTMGSSGEVDKAPLA